VCTARAWCPLYGKIQTAKKTAVINTDLSHLDLKFIPCFGLVIVIAGTSVAVFVIKYNGF